MLKLQHCLLTGLLLGATAIVLAVPSNLPAVPAVQKAVRPDIVKTLGANGTKAVADCGNIDSFTSRFRLPLRMTTAKDPWAGMAQFEANGLQVAKGAASAHPVAATLDAMAASMGKPAGKMRHISLSCHTRAEGVATIRRVLEAAEDLRQNALAQLTDGNCKYLFEQTLPLLQNYGPQLGPLTDENVPVLRSATQVMSYIDQRYDWPQFIGAAQTLAQLGDAGFRRDLQRVFKKAPPVVCSIPGVTGDVLYAEATPLGWIIIGGFGDNAYTITSEPVAAIIDLGGHDTYLGSIASSFDAKRANSLIIDCDGHNTYSNYLGENQAVPLGLATGRLGVGMLIDCGGHSTFNMYAGSGGVGIGGIGVLYAMGGHDTFTGSIYTQGVAIGGLGLLLADGIGNTHTAQLYSIGVGGCQGVGAVVNPAGGSSYRCGFASRSPYNDEVCPSDDPKDPDYEYEAWGIGIGIGRRVYPWPAGEFSEFLLDQLAGGIGMVISGGNDKIESSNFSQGCGYFFGAGLLLELGGKNIHSGARYAIGASAHQGIGLAIDAGSENTYVSSGQKFTCGGAWDRSSALCLNTGSGKNNYQLQRTSGFGVADVSSIALFADLGTNNTYATRSGLGAATKQSLAIFYTPGLADYTAVPAVEKFKPRNAQIASPAEGSLFISHAKAVKGK